MYCVKGNVQLKQCYNMDSIARIPKCRSVYYILYTDRVRGLYSQLHKTMINTKLTKL